MKYFILIVLLGGAAVVGHAQGTAFTYQGRLNDGSAPANGSYDFKFLLFDSPTTGDAAGPLTNSAVAVSNGLFTTHLDFGAGVFTGATRWLEIAVRANGSDSFATLNPRQPIAPVPMALYAMTPAGPPGPQGLTGDQGPAGPQGATGATGSQGPQGPAGPQGDTGVTGLQGSQGPTGATGPQGPEGLNWLGAWNSSSNYVADDAVFFNGSAWAARRSNLDVSPAEGEDWTPLAQQGAQGAQGPQGLTGDQGPAGPQGAAGATGPQGPEGLNWLGAWNTSSNYVADDAVFFNGSAWAARRANLNVSPAESDDWTTLAQQGAQGPQGPQGLTGAQGPAGPQGATGATGPQGAQGPIGPAGPEGPPGASTFGLNGTNAFYIAGNVGIGISAPNAPLHIAKQVPVLALQDADSLSTQVGLVSFRNSGGAETAWLGFGSSGNADATFMNNRSAGRTSLGAGGLERLTVTSSGDAGIGTTTPQAKLDVRGDIRLGPSGQFRATSGEENLRIVRGVVGLNGNILQGTSFSVAHPSAGLYSITFDTPFSGPPAVTATAHFASGSTAFVMTLGVTAGAADLLTYRPTGGVFADHTFHFIAIGPR